MFSDSNGQIRLCAKQKFNFLSATNLMILGFKSVDGILTLIGATYNDLSVESAFSFLFILMLLWIQHI